MLKFDLKSAMLQFEAKTGMHLTYEKLGQMTSISPNTLKSIATRVDYNATLKMITEIAISLNINPIPYFEWSENGENNARKADGPL